MYNFTRRGGHFLGVPCKFANIVSQGLDRTKTGKRDAGDLVVLALFLHSFSHINSQNRKMLVLTDLDFVFCREYGGNPGIDQMLEVLVVFRFIFPLSLVSAALSL